ncbi:MAG: glycosyltransferase [Janthinobacterium lividum]
MALGTWSKFAAGSFSPVKSPVRQYQRSADAERDAGRWAQAAILYRRVLDLTPDRAPIWVQYGHALKEDGRIAAALAAYLEAARLAPDTADTQLQIGHALKLQGRQDAATEAYAKALALDAGLEHARHELQQLDPPAAAPSLRPGGDDPDDDPLLPPPPPPPPPPRLTPPPEALRLSAADRDAADALLLRHGLLPHALAYFDADFYATAQGLPDEGGDRLAAILRHFCETGIDRLAPLNERFTFDPGFHERLYPGSFRLSPADRYRQWLNRGIPLGEAPNMTVWVQDVTGWPVRDLDQLDLGFHRAAVAELAGMPDTQAIEWLADGGLLDERLDHRLNPDRLALLATAAQRATARGEIPLAISFMERVLAQEPLRQPVVQAYADRLTDWDQPFAAVMIYRQILSAGLGNWQTHAHLYAALRKQRRFEEAFEAITAGVKAFPQYPTLRQSRADALEDFWHACHREYQPYAEAGRIPEGQAVIARYCDLATRPLTEERLPPRPVRSVALFSLLDLAQCRFYRVDQKIEQLERAGYTVTLFDSNTEAAVFQERIRQFEAVIFYRVAPLPQIIPAILAARAMGLITVYEIDDLLFLADEYPGPLAGYAGQITVETYNMLALGVPLFLGALRMCDYALASTPTLAHAMAPFVRTGRSFLHRNGMGSDHERYLDYEAPVQPADQPVVIFYGSGTRAHKEEFQLLLEPALIEIARRHRSKVSFVMVGWLPISDAFRAAAGDTLTLVEPAFDLHAYWDMLKESDINLAVLQPSLTVDAKSEIKWMEAALFGIPSIVSRTATYAEVIEDGSTGFLCDTLPDWIAALDRLVRDAGLRRRVGLAAQRAVRAAYTIDAMAGTIRGIMAAVSPPPPPPRQKVLLVNVFYAPQLFGGATRVMHDNILHLARRHGDEFELEVFTTIDQAPVEYALSSYPQDGLAVTGVARSVAGETSGQVSDPKMAALFRAHLETTRPDLIHFHCIQRLTVAVVDVAREMGIPYVITAHDAWWISDHQFLIDAWGRERTYDFTRPRQVLRDQGRSALSRMQALRPALMGAAAVLGVSEPFSAIYRRCGVPNVRTVANGLSPIQPLPRRPRAEGRVRLGHVGGMVRHKGFHLLRQVLSAGTFDNLALLLVDHGKPRTYRHAERWGGVPVEIIGKRDPDDVASLYAEIDVLVAPSTWAESYGLVTREAQACGCWVIASDRGAIGGDVADGVNGFVVDVADGRGLTAALQRIDGDPTRFRAPPPERALRRAEDQGEELAALYRSLQRVPSAVRPPAPC